MKACVHVVLHVEFERVERGRVCKVETIILVPEEIHV
jgi:hypothetical protein